MGYISFSSSGNSAKQGEGLFTCQVQAKHPSVLLAVRTIGDTISLRGKEGLGRSWKICWKNLRKRSVFKQTPFRDQKWAIFFFPFRALVFFLYLFFLSLLLLSSRVSVIVPFPKSKIWLNATKAVLRRQWENSNRCWILRILHIFFVWTKYQVAKIHIWHIRVTCLLMPKEFKNILHPYFFSFGCGGPADISLFVL